MVEVPVLHNLLELLQHRLALPTHARLEAKEVPNPRLTRLFRPHLLLHVRHLHGRFVPQLVGQTQLHLHAFVHQVPQGGHGLTGPLCEEQTLTPLSPSPGRRIARYARFTLAYRRLPGRSAWTLYCRTRWQMLSTASVSRVSLQFYTTLTAGMRIKRPH